MVLIKNHLERINQSEGYYDAVIRLRMDMAFTKPVDLGKLVSLWQDEVQKSRNKNGRRMDGADIMSVGTHDNVMLMHQCRHTTGADDHLAVSSFSTFYRLAQPAFLNSISSITQFHIPEDIKRHTYSENHVKTPHINEMVSYALIRNPEMAYVYYRGNVKQFSLNHYFHGYEYYRCLPKQTFYEWEPLYPTDIVYDKLLGSTKEEKEDKEDRRKRLTNTLLQVICQDLKVREAQHSPVQIFTCPKV